LIETSIGGLLRFGYHANGKLYHDDRVDKRAAFFNAHLVLRLLISRAAVAKKII